MLFSFWYRKDTQFNKELTTIQWTPNNQQNGSFCAWDHDHQHPPWPGEQPRAWDHDHQGDGGGGRADHVSDQPGCPDGDFTTEWFNPRFSASYGAVYQREAGQAWTWPCPCMQVRHRLKSDCWWCRCIEVLERLEQRLECPVCLTTTVGQVFQCHRFLFVFYIEKASEKSLLASKISWYQNSAYRVTDWQG